MWAERITSASSTADEAEHIGASKLPTTAWRYARANWRNLVKYVAPAAIMVFLLWAGAMYQLRPQYGITGDVWRYQCFAVSFWGGAPAQRLPDVHPKQCDRINAAVALERQELNASHLPQPVKQWLLENSATDQPFHTLPVEYPVLTLIPFSLPLLLPFVRYTIAFALELTILGLLAYVFLIRLKGWKVAALFALCYGAAAYGTGVARFDLIPAVVSLLALVCAERRRWLPAYLLVVAATFLKYYPVVLFLPLVIYHWQSLPKERRLRELAKALGVSAAASAVLGGLMLAINPLMAYFQLGALRSRPLEVESLGASIVYLGDALLNIPFQRVKSFGSDNLTGVLAGPAAMVITLLAVLGVAVLLVKMAQRRLTLQQAWLALLLVVIITGKIFSTQYIIWVLPIMAYALTTEGLGPVLWLLVCALTSLGYPGLFGQEPKGFYKVVLLRNVLLVVFTLAAIWPRLWPGLFPAATSDGDGPDAYQLAGDAAPDLELEAPVVSVNTAGLS